MEGKANNYFVYISAITICIICFSTGTAYSWTSPLLPKFNSSDPNINPIGRPLTISESGLIVSIINLGLVFGPFLGGAIVGRIGKKMSLLLTSLPIFISHIICAVANNVAYFLVARFLMGITTGAVWAIIPGYLSEISTPNNRGFLNSLCLIISCSGVLFAYSVGPYISVTWFSIINLLPVVLFLVLLYVSIPESPFDLVMKSNIAAARESLTKLRQTSNIQKELLEIERIVDTMSKTHATIGDIFRNKGSSRAMLLGGALMGFNACSGSLIVLGYTQTIFEIAGAAIPSDISAIINGSVSIIASLVSSQLVDRLGRKPIMILSCLITSLAHGTLGIYFHFMQNSDLDMQSIGWLPVCCVISFTFFFYFGMGPMPWLIIGELFSANIRAIASTFCTTINFILSFVITLLYPYFIQSIGIANTFLFFSVMLMFCFIFCIVKLPETKGKSFEQIFTLLSKS